MSFVSTSIAEPNLAPVVLKTTPSQRQTERDVVNVMHVINGEHFSGAERVQQLLGKQLGQFGFDPHFACVKPGKFREYCGLREDQIIDTPMGCRFDFRVVLELTRIARLRSVQLLHAHTPRTALVTSLVARQTGIPWVYHVHSPTARDSTRGIVNRINTQIERYSIRKCDLLLTVSRSLRREMLRLGVPRSRLGIVPNGVPAIDPICAGERLEFKKWRLGMIALMRPRKGVEVALKAMRDLRDKNLPVELELIGGFESDEYQALIMRMIASLRLRDCVKWTGFTNDVSSAIRRLDALLLPSLFGEGMPMVVLEAIAAAVPVVATSVEGTPEIVRDGVEGYLAEPKSSSSLAEKITLMTSDRCAWARMSRHAIERHRESFSDVRMAQRVARAYEKVLS